MIDEELSQMMGSLEENAEEAHAEYLLAYNAWFKRQGETCYETKETMEEELKDLVIDRDKKHDLYEKAYDEYVAEERRIDD